MATPALVRLVDENLRRAPEYRDGLTNHLPMALQALHALGADDAALERFALAYVERTGLPMATTVPAALADTSRRLGDFGTFRAWRAHFTARIAATGPRGALVETLPVLWPGVAAAAFHGAIRVAHAWELGHTAELAAALAYWAARWQPIDVGVEPAPTLDLDDWLAAAEAAAGCPCPDRPLISQRMEEASHMPAVRRFAAHLRRPGDALPRVARWAAGLYADTGNFTVLHVVTGSRAILHLSELSPPPPPQVWHALAAAIVASGVSRRRPVPAPKCSWDEVVAAARTSLDDHVVKLVHACVQLSGNGPEDEFLAAARRALATTAAAS